MKYMKKFMPIILTMLSASAVLTLAVMVFWNKFLASTTGVSEISFWLAAVGWLLVAISISIFTWLKALAAFVTLTISLAIAKKKLQKTTDAQADLLKHFSMFGAKK